jgi:hypothetical protein
LCGADLVSDAFAVVVRPKALDRRLREAGVWNARKDDDSSQRHEHVP